MRVADLPGADADAERALEAAGIPNAEQLSRVEDLTSLAERARIPEPKLQDLRDAARAAIERALHDAGVADESALATADLRAVSRKTGIPVAELLRFRELARRAVGLAPEDTRVELHAGASSATVRVGDTPLEGLTILTEQDALAAHPGDAVLLLEGATSATARYAGATHEDLPLVVGGERVRVLGVRAGAAPAEAPPSAKGDPFWRRVFKGKAAEGR